jgi:hypothetical protein
MAPRTEASLQLLAEATTQSQMGARLYSQVGNIVE